MSALPKTLPVVDEAVIARVARVAKLRGNDSTTRTARDLLHERLLELEEHGDPAAIAPEPQPAKSDAAAQQP